MKGIPRKKVTSQKKGSSADRTKGVFDERPEGLFYRTRGQNGEFEWEQVCSLIELIARTRDADGKNWGVLVKVADPDGRKHELTISFEDLAGDSKEVRAVLLAHGLRLRPGRKSSEHLNRYLIEVDPGVRIRCVPKTGWLDETQFVLPDQTFGCSEDERIVYQPPRQIEHHFAVEGTLEDWQREIGSLCVGNYRLAFAVSAPFAAPLLRLLGLGGGGFNLVGESSTGKSTLLRAAGSVCGGGGKLGYGHSWRATNNAAEGLAEGHNDCLLILDEMGEIDARIVGDTAYLLANGIAKARMTRTTEMRRQGTWTLLVLSSSELSLAEHIAQSGQRARGGQLARICDIPADAGKGHGVFDKLHGERDGAHLSQRLCSATDRYYGAPLREYLKKITEDPEWAMAFVKEPLDQFVSDNVPEKSSGEIHRVAARFGAVAAAGELAVEYGILPWRRNAATLGAILCFDAWLEARGGSLASDVENGLRQVRQFLQTNQARFLDVRKSKPLYNLAGCKDGRGELLVYYVFPGVFQNEACRGYDYKAIARELRRRGLLVAESDRLQTYTPTQLASGTRARAYAIKAEFLNGEEG